MSQAAKTGITETTDTLGAARYTLWQLVRYMLRLGTWGFGGPVALVLPSFFMVVALGAVYVASDCWAIPS